MDERIVGLATGMLLLYLLCQWQFRELGKRVKELEDRATGAEAPTMNLGDLRNPNPETLRQALDPAWKLKDPDA